MEEQYTSNSHRSKEKQTNEPEKKVERVITSAVKKKKKTGLGRFAENFVSEDAGHVKDYVFKDVLIPALKKMIYDMFTNGLDMTLFGGRRNSSGSMPTNRISYRGYYDSPRREREERPYQRSVYQYDEIVIPNRSDAEEVLDALQDLIDRYQTASVADLYDLVGLQPNHTDNKYGWTDVRSADVIRVIDGYQLKLPKALPLD